MKPSFTNFGFYIVFTSTLFLGMTPMANSQSTGGIQPVQMTNVPITFAIENLAQQSGINFMIDPKLFPPPGNSNGNAASEPTVTFNWTDLSSSDALARLLKEHSLVMVQDKFTTVALITGTNHVANLVDASLLASTNTADQTTDAPIPVSQFQDVPLDEALNSLVKQEHINVVLDPKVSTYVDPADHTFHTAQAVSLRWKNLTGRQAIVALCEIYDLAITKDVATGIIRIKPKD